MPPIKIEKPITKKYPPVKLYLEDLTAIEDILTDTNTTTTIDVSTQDDRFKSIKELLDYIGAKRITRLKIHASSHNSDATIQFEERFAGVTIAPNTNTNMGLFHKIDELITRRVLPLHWLYNFFTLQILLTVNLVLLLIAFLYRHNQPAASLAFLLVFSILGVLVLALSLRTPYLMTKRHSLIILAQRRSLLSFSPMNKEELYKDLLKDALKIIAGVVLGYLLKAVGK